MQEVVSQLYFINKQLLCETLSAASYDAADREDDGNNNRQECLELDESAKKASKTATNRLKCAVNEIDIATF